MRMLKRISMIPALFLSLAFFCPDADCRTKASEPVFQLAPVTVTARKIEENMQNVPISIDAFTQARLEDARIENTQDLVRFSPNAHMKFNYYENLVVLRGISTFRASLYSPVVSYVDGVSYPLHYTQNTELFDLERAEILKGPQGTLYGRNSESGVINIITRQPDNQFRSKVFSEYGSYDTFRAGFNVSGPVAEDRLYLGGAFQYKSSDGFVENRSTGDDTGGDLEHLNGRLTVRWTPSERLDISLIADAMDADDHCGGHRLLSGPKRTSPFEYRSDADEYYRQDGNSQVLRMKYDGGWFHASSVSSIMSSTLEKLNDTDLWDDPANRMFHANEFEQRQYTQEIRFSSPPKSPWQWVAGLYGFIDDTRIDYIYHLASRGKIRMNPVSDLDSKGCAAFGQGTVTLFDALHLTAGLRFDHQALDGEVDDAVTGRAARDKLRYDEWLPKFSAAHDLSKEVMVYASASRGYLTGGYNFSMPPRPETFTYDPEYSWNYELGIKTTWLDKRIMANLSIFHIDIKDKQVMEYDWDTLAKTISNSAKAHSRGIELQLQAKVRQGLDVFAGFGFTEARFDTFTPAQMDETGTALIEKNHKDNYLPYAPKYSYNVGVQYRTPGGLFARADLMGTGKFYGDAENTSKQDAYETVNLRMGYEGAHFEFHLWADNVFDERYLTFIYPYKDSFLALDGAPRTIGATLTWRF